MTRISFIVIMALLLGACAHTGLPDLGEAPPAKMPELPQTLNQRATQLPPIVDPTLGGIHKDGVATDMHYNDLALRYNALLDVYQCVKKSLEAKDASVADKCLR